MEQKSIARSCFGPLPPPTFVCAAHHKGVNQEKDAMGWSWENCIRHIREKSVDVAKRVFALSSALVVPCLWMLY